jgi:hypothetical protein
MIKTQSSIPITYLFELRSRLSNVVEKSQDQIQRDFFRDLIDILLLELPHTYDDIQKRGIYKTLILGVDNLAVIDSFVGVDTSALLSSDISYLVRINRTLLREPTLKIDFTQSHDLSKENERIITRVFRSKNPKVDIARYLSNSQIPSLLLKDFDLSQLQSFDDDIALLKLTDLIEKITVNKCLPNYIDNSNDVFSLCRCIDIVPDKYYRDGEKNSIELLRDFSESKFYNFIILNSMKLSWKFKINCQEKFWETSSITLMKKP